MSQIVGNLQRWGLRRVMVFGAVVVLALTLAMLLLMLTLFILQALFLVQLLIWLWRPSTLHFSRGRSDRRQVWT